MRMQSTDKSIIGNDNGGNVATVGDLGFKVNGPAGAGAADPDFNYLQTDDGNLNYKRHDIVSAVFTISWSKSFSGRGCHVAPRK